MEQVPSGTVARSSGVGHKAHLRFASLAGLASCGRVWKRLSLLTQVNDSGFNIWLVKGYKVAGMHHCSPPSSAVDRLNYHPLPIQPCDVLDAVGASTTGIQLTEDSCAA